jgi:glutathione peroxidase-family protein
VPCPSSSLFIGCVIAIFFAIFLQFNMSSSNSDFDKENASGSPFYSFRMKDASRKDFDFAQLKGQVVLCVNVASQCGFTNQYAGLENLYRKFKDRGFTILGFPCNQFLNQEPGSEEEIKDFCSRTYNVTFPILQKIEVNGANTHPVYAWLKSQKKSLLMERIKWNFEKFLVGADGRVIDRYSSLAKPEQLEDTISQALSKSRQ